MKLVDILYELDNREDYILYVKETPFYGRLFEVMLVNWKTRERSIFIRSKEEIDGALGMVDIPTRFTADNFVLD